MLRERVGERMAAEHFGADRGHQFADVVALRLFGQHRGVSPSGSPRSKARELAREDRLFALRQTPPERKPLIALAARARARRLDDERREPCVRN